MRKTLGFKRLAVYTLASVQLLGMGSSLLGAEVGRTSLHGHVPGILARLTPIGLLSASTNLSLAIGLPLRNRAELDDFLRQLQDPRSTNYHKYLTPRQFTERFGPTEQEYQSVVQFARANGFTVIGTHPNRVVLDVEASVSNIEHAFNINLRLYRHPTEARDFYAPNTEPSVPTNVPVIDVEGLSDYQRPHPLLRPAKPPPAKPLSGSGPSGYYAGKDFRNAYAPGTTLTGAGQTVGLLEFSSYYQSDITNYENTIGMTNYVPLNNVVVGHPTPGAANNAEVALDIEVAIAMAPGLSQVIVYESSRSPATLLSRMATDNLAKQISCSWTWGGGPSTTVDNLLQQMAAQGQSFFQASGDSDAYTGANALDNSSLPDAPVDSTNVITVGGTTLTMNGAGTSWSSEKVWNYDPYGGTFANVGSSGGISTYYAIPEWQTNVSMAANSGSTVWRNIPDVALTADQVYVAYNNGGSGGFGGTSCAAPLWAGFCALVNELSVSSGGSTVGFINPALYAIAASSNYAACFHDVTSGNNIGTNTPGLFYAVAGYDLCTGLGTPTGTNLINALVPSPYISLQPISQTVTNGSTVVFSVAAGGQTPFSYQWLFNGTNLPAGGNASGVTSNELTLASVTPANSGDYSVVVTNSLGSVTSSVAVLEVGLAPFVSKQPTNLIVLSGGDAVFTADVGGSSPLTLQWRQNGTNLTDGIGVSGTASNVLTLTAVTTNRMGDYDLSVTNMFGATTSSAATLTVVAPPSITTSSLTNRTVECGNNNIAFNLTTSGTAPLYLQWRLDGLAVAGATNTSFSLTNLLMPDHTVSVVVTNLYGSATSNAVVTILDTLGPVITLNGGNPVYLELDNAFTDPGATASDACAGTVPVVVSGMVNTNIVGTNMLVYTADDGNGNTNTVARAVIVQDTTPPTIQWSFTNLVLAADTNCGALLPNLTGTNYILATDLSEPLTISQSPTNGTVLAEGSNTIVLTVMDVYGNPAYSTNTVLVRDQTPPVITLNGSDPIYTELGNSFTDPGATAYDDCAGPVPVKASGLVETNVVGTNTLVYTADDGQGNTNTATRAVIVQDTTPPTIQWSFTNLTLLADTNCSAVLPDLTGTNYILATDLSEPLTISQSPTNGTVLAEGSNTVVLTVVDAYGNAAYSTNTVLVHDQTPPVITLNGTNPLYTELGSSFTDPGATAYDLCAGVVPVAATGIVDTGVVGTNTLTYTADDGQGNTNTATRAVIVQDTTPPTIQWSFTNLVLATDTNCTAVLPDLTGTNFIVATDLSEPLTISQNPTNGTVLVEGTNTVLLTVMDLYGNAAYSTNAVLVQDQTPPIITLNGGNPVYLELGNAFTDPGATASDACAGTVPVVVSGMVNTNIVGTNMLVYTADDGNGNTNTVARAVIVQDTTPPTIQWSFTNLVLAADTNCSALLPNLTGTNYILATDLSEPLTISQSPTNGTVLAEGSNTIVLAVMDAYGNPAYSTNTVLVHDQTPPLITLNGTNPIYTELGNSFTDPGATAYDDCAGPVPVTAGGLVETNVVGTNTLVYTADDGQGNTNTATRAVIVQDTTPPTIQWSFTNLTLLADTNCSAVLPDLTGTNYILAIDLSEPLSISQSPTNGTVLAEGSNTVVLTVVDAYGNAAYSTNTVLVHDQTPPVITLNGTNPLYTELGSSFTDPGATAYDLCAGVVPVVVTGIVDTGMVGTNTLVYTADDGQGNTNTATRAVIVQDTTSPTIQWSFTNLVLAADTNCSALLPNLTGTNYILATDLSEPLTISQSPTNGTVLAEGSNTIVLAVMDAYGNASYSTNTVLVHDQTPPVITLNGTNPLYTELGSSFIDPGATASDACAGTVPVVVSGTVNTNIVGTNTLVYTADDGNGNTNIVVRAVIVQDTTPPTIQWSFANLVLATDTNCTAVLPDLTGTNYILATDLSEPLTVVQSPTDGTVLAKGSNTVLLTVMDAYGNAAYSTNAVLVQDQTPPVIWSQPLSQTNKAGTDASFSVVAQACTPLVFQWFFNDSALVGQTNYFLTLSNINSTMTGDYSAVITASGGSTTSAVAVLTVQLLDPSVTLTSSENPSGFKDNLNFTLLVAPTNATGSVQFLTNNAAFDASSLAAGTAVSVTNSALPRGTNFVMAIYSGDTMFLPATNTLAQIVTNHPPIAPTFFTNRYAGFPVEIPVAVLATNWSDLDGDPVSLAGIGVSTNGVTVTNDAGILVYSNSNDVDDVFVCTLTDGWGGTNSQTVSITVVPLPPDAIPAITSVSGSTNSTILLELAGSPGFTYILEATTNLGASTDWIPVTTNTLETNGVWNFSDPTTNSPSRFYRLRLSH